jgi:hypothetical protein
MNPRVSGAGKATSANANALQNDDIAKRLIRIEFAVVSPKDVR